MEGAALSIDTEHDLEGLRRAGRLVAAVLRAVRREVRPGITTAALDRVAEKVLHATGGRSAPQVEYGFPGTILISVNDEAVHGVPGPRAVEPGDVVKLDVTVELDGYVADAATTVAVEPVSEAAHALCAGTRAALDRGLEAARAGRPISAIGAAVQAEARRRGLSVIRELTGHGVGRRIHEPPTVPNYPAVGAGAILTEGLVIAIEPVLSAGCGRIVEAADGWTLRTADGALAAHFEHTVVVTHGRPILLTAA
jgi:methionyl aminopeptidase